MDKTRSLNPKRVELKLKHRRLFTFFNLIDGLLIQPLNVFSVLKIGSRDDVKTKPPEEVEKQEAAVWELGCPLC